jgi:hypothetical protein
MARGKTILNCEVDPRGNLAGFSSVRALETVLVPTCASPMPWARLAALGRKLSRSDIA